jgi:hypothetical protein
LNPPADNLISDETLDELALVFARAAVEHYVRSQSGGEEPDPTHVDEEAA